MHPEGRLLAIQQQIHFGKLLADAMKLEHQEVLNALAIAGMRLSPDEGEIAIDASNVLPSITTYRSRLQVVKDK